MRALDVIEWLALAGLVIWSLHRVWLVLLRLRSREREPEPEPERAPRPAPRVTVQLPIFNERCVAERLIEAVAALRWPADRLQIQVLDDSTDDTSEIVAAAIARQRIAIEHVRRPTRDGFKAGALQHGLATARGEFILVLDADFVPPADFLERLMPHFADETIGCVQARWGHLNEDASPLTAAQALILDGHFRVEQTARWIGGRFFNFNGTAGVWRRATIESAGGWHADTLTEDTDLSYRAQLAGWRFRFVDDVTAPAELPAAMRAFKSQQFRWAKGQTQVARKLLGAIVTARLPWRVKIEAALHLGGNVAYLLLLGLCLLALPRAIDGGSHPAAAIAASTALAGHVLFYVAASPRPLRALLRLPVVLSVCAGLCVSQARAVIEALCGRPSEFVRTPKRGAGAGRGRGYRVGGATWGLIELGLGCWVGAAAVLLASRGSLVAVAFLLPVVAGLLWVGLATAFER